MRKTLCGLIFCSCWQYIAAANLLHNADFELWKSDGHLLSWTYHWQKKLPVPDQSIKKTGNVSLHIPPQDGPFSALLGYADDIDKYPESLYIRGWCKYEDLLIGRQNDSKNYTVPFVGIWTNLADGKNSFTIPVVEFSNGSRDWFFFERKILLGEVSSLIASQQEDRRPSRFSFRINIGQQPGSIWLDGLEMIDPNTQVGIPVVIDTRHSDAEFFAAKELASYLKKITGLQSEIQAATQYKSGTAAIIIGLACSKLDGFEFENLEAEEWAFKSHGNALTITGGSGRGIVYGVYEFLEKQLGCLWIDHQVEIVPSKPDWRLPNLDERASPAFSYREIYTAIPVSGLWRLRNKESFRTVSEPPGMSVNFGSPAQCHTFAYYTKQWDWVKDRELFAVTKAGGQGSQPCMSNPETIRRFMVQLEEYIRKDREKATHSLNFPLIYDLSQDDGAAGSECYCPDCKKIFLEEGAYSGVNCHFINNIAREIGKKYPEIMLRTFAYSYTQQAPKNISTAQNVVVQSCNSNLSSPCLPNTSNGRILEQWRGHAKNLAIWAYWRPYVGFEYPFVKPRKEMQEELKFCKSNKVIHYFAENENYDYKRAFFQLGHFIGLKLLQNPELELDLLVDRFMSVYYGKAAPPMLKYLSYLERRQGEALASQNKCIWSYLDADFFEVVNSWLDEAEILVEAAPLHLRNVQSERVPVDNAMLSLGDKTFFSKSSSRKLVIERFKKNSLQAIMSSYGADWNSRVSDIEKRLSELDNELSLYEAMPVPIPEQFQGKNIIDLHWKDFSPYSDHIARCLMDDPEAVCKKAFQVPDAHIDYKKHGRSAVHILPFNYGLYRGSSDVTRELVKDQIPQDEQYHWYYVGQTELNQNVIIWLHWSWMLQIYLRKALGFDIVPPTVDVFISMKLTGPGYVQNSNLPNAALVDRVILVKK